ncbi:hypothetical protein JYG23_09695 [Sedimentibacter sp. zth1]|uniref:hypothetical protein n=1 Tax=Sedimentibacter sp. zth1 TaxID=2816908 RepID=UPI001A913B50|nr:hypothetical protein [Sedimentibacter sp. zth1]QSX04962.1 hypothetical protein JYG23_09695 [Sedimentibacter sp. zth1]
MSNILKKVIKLFSIFILIIFSLGVFIMIINNNRLYVVEASRVKTNDIIKEVNEFTGVIGPKYYIDIYANDELSLENVYIKSAQIVEDKSLFKLVTANNIVDKNSITVKSENNNENIKDDIENIQINQSGEFSVSNKVYIDYISENVQLKKGELICRYCYYDTNVYVEANVSSDVLNKVVNQRPKIQFKNNNILQLKMVDYNEFQDYGQVYFDVEGLSQSTMKLYSNVELEIVKDTQCDTIVPKTAFLSYEGIKEGASGVIYIIVEEKTILGKQNVLYEQSCEISTVGKNELGISIDNWRVSPNDIKNVVKYPTSKLKMNMRVRVK